MGPSIAESAVQRGRFAWVLGILAASVTTLVVVAAPCHRHQRPHHPRFEHHPLKRLGHCVDGRWVYAPRQ